MNQYEVVEGHVFVVDAVEFNAGEIIELTDEQAEEALKLGHVVRVETAPVVVEEPVIAVDPALEGSEATVVAVVDGGEVVSTEVVPPVVEAEQQAA